MPGLMIYLNIWEILLSDKSMNMNTETYQLTGTKKISVVAVVLCLIGVIASGIGYFMDTDQFLHSYLISFVFWVMIGLGGLFFVMVHHLTGANWSVVVRRIFENIMVVVPFMFIFAIPLILNLDRLYHWSIPEVMHSDHLLEGKAPFLNDTFFIIRFVGYFVIWFVLSRLLYKSSLKQDKGEPQIKRMRLVSAPGMILFALSITFAGFDWVMSLDAHWYSTIFGAYIFAGSVLSVLSFLTLFVFYMKRKNILGNIITVEHYHDFGKLMFAFIIFWGYMAFSQYFLIWYGNIPEETVWFLHRWQGGWKTITLMIVFGHFVIPFFYLFPQGVKKNAVALIIISFWILAIHWIDLYWLIMPGFLHEHVHFSWMDVSTMLAMGGFFVGIFLYYTRSQPLVPVNDPGLEKSIKFVNH